MSYELSWSINGRDYSRIYDSSKNSWVIRRMILKQIKTFRRSINDVSFTLRVVR